MNKGITLIEVLVVVGLTAFLSGMLLVYSAASRAQISLSVEVARVTQLILRAKSLTLASYTGPAGPCGYGVHFNYTGAQAYALIRYATPNPSDCANIVSINPAYTQTIQEFFIDQRVQFEEGADRIDDVVFLPPEPEALVSVGGVLLSSGAGNIYLRTRDLGAGATITVSTAGQVNF